MCTLCKKWPNSYAIFLGAAIVMGAATFCPNLSAGAYPGKSIRMVVPYSPGGGTDVMARAVARFLESEVGQKVVVINRPGASGTIGTAEVARGRHDGYTTIMLSSNDYILAPLMNTDPGFSLEDFKLVASFNDTANSLIVKKGSQFKTFPELVDYARKNPGRLTVSASGDAHVFLAAMISLATGAQVSIVSYSGAGESLNALLGGHVEAAIIDRRFVRHAEQGGCKALAVASEQRFDVLPELPTFLELGYHISDSQRRILAVPAKTPDSVVETLTAAIIRFGNSDEFKEKMASLGEASMIETGVLLNNFIGTQSSVFSDTIQANKERFPIK